MNFNERTAKRLKSLWDSQTSRAAEKKSKKTKRVTRHGYRLMFDKQQFTDWLQRHFGMDLGGLTRCPYCNRPIDFFSCEIDHIEPTDRGGLPSLHNMVPACDVCNPAKGALNGQEFRSLLGKIAELNREFPDGVAVVNIMHRLQSYSGLKASANAHRAQKFQRSRGESSSARYFLTVDSVTGLR